MSVTVKAIFENEQVKPLPVMENHRAPFNRFIISTALTENMSIMTDDDKFKAYHHLVIII